MPAPLTLVKSYEWNFNSIGESGQPYRVAESSSPKKSIHSPRYNAFLEQLREARHAAGLTQREAAQKLDRPQSWVAQSEIGERRVDVVELLDFLDAYGVRPGKFLEKL